MAPFLTIVTRHLPSRAERLAACKKSLAMQTSRDFEHVILTDEEGVGVGASHLKIGRRADCYRGDYIYVLDDDDKLICPHFVDCMRDIGQHERPDVIMVRMDYGGTRLPAWEQPPQEGHVSTQNYIVRRDVFLNHRAGWTDRYQADYDFISAVWADRPNVHWHDCVAVADQRGRGLGRQD